jgi:AI-2 transport protein TqsA
MAQLQSVYVANRSLLNAACLIVVVAGLKTAGGLIVPLLIAAFLAILCTPVLRRLQARGVPAWLVILVLLTLLTLVLLMLSAVLTSSILQFQAAIPRYRDRIEELLGASLLWLAAHGLDVPEQPRIVALVGTGAILQFVAELALSLVGILSNLLLVVVTAGFMLVEVSSFEGKLRLVLGEESGRSTALFGIGLQVQRYLMTKTATSLATGMLVLVLLTKSGVDFPRLWALLAFLFNFIPNVGSILAAVPAVLLALVQFGPGGVLLVAGGYALINLLIGNLIEPRLMGRRLGLSPLVVLLSLFFWGWVWGPLGMVLSVPLTVIARIVLEHSRDFHWVSVLLGPEEPTPPAPGAVQPVEPVP